MRIINIPEFIDKYIVKRSKSLFADDINDNREKLNQHINEKSVLVIGGAGTIGSSYIKSILNFNPKKLIVVDIDENGLTELTRDLRSSYNKNVPDVYKTYPMSYGDPVFEKMFLDLGPFDIVANFAAHKHVRSEKDIYSIQSMVENNVLNAKNLLELLSVNKPKHFFCVSSDKATNPVNIMGASKRLMEDLIFSYSQKFKITTARFANVAFSNGSLLDGYLKRIFKNQPISCPNDVKRFFVSPNESGEICLLASVLGESGQVFFPKIDKEEMISFKEITVDFFKSLNKEIHICLSEKEAKERSKDLNNKDSYPVYFFKTDTSGEKLFEEFYSKNDNINMNKYKSLGIISNFELLNKNDLSNILLNIQNFFTKGNLSKDDFVGLLKKYITNFNHNETGKNLDQKM